MQALFCRVGVSVVFLFMLLAFFPDQAQANPYGVRCENQFYLNYATIDQYCNTSTTYSDIGGLPAAYQTAIMKLTNMNIFTGYGAGSGACGGGPNCFLPNNHITRWEAAAIIARYHIHIKKDWYPWDPANDPEPSNCDCGADIPTKNFDGTYIADVEYWMGGAMEMHSALLHRWILGGNCSGFYPYDSGTGKYYVAHLNKYVNGNDRCFAPYNDWVFGFHGVERADAAYEIYTEFPINTTPAEHRFYYCNFYSPVQDGTQEGACEESWQGQWYKFASGGDAPYYMTRAEFAYRVYQYYLDVDNSNYCASTPSGSITGSALQTDGSGNYCVIHAGQSSCSTPLTWSSTNTVSFPYCNTVYFSGPGGVTLPPYDMWFYGGGTNVLGTGTSGSLTSQSTTSPSDTKTYQLKYYYEMNSYLDAKHYDLSLRSLSFSARFVSGTISFPGGSCTIPSGPATTCSQPVSWSTTYITDPATVTFRDVTNNVTISSNGLSGSTNRTISGPTTFKLYENGIEIASQTVSPTKLRAITGTVYVDYKDNAAVDAADGDGVFTEGTTISLYSNCSNTTVATTTSNGSGAFAFNNVQPCVWGYAVSIPTAITSATYPDGLHPSTVQTNPMSAFPVSSDVIVNFYISPYYRVTGGVFLDVNKNGRKEAGESYYTAGAITVTSSNGGTISYPSNGLYQIGRLPAGPLTVTLTSAIPNGYVITIPLGGAGSPSYNTQVGKACAANPVSPTGGDGGCLASGNLYDVNFGISNSTPWIQGIGMDMRFDEGLANPIPSLTNACGAIYTMKPTNAADVTTQGGVFIGNSSKNNAFGVRQTPSSEGWVMDTLYPETFRPVVSGTVRTSYAYLNGAVTRSGLTQTNLNTIAGCSDPSISCTPANLATGVYTNDGNVILSSLTVPANRNIILLIRGNLTINGAVTVPTTSTLTVAVGETTAGAGGDITVATTVGGAPACVPPTGQVQGFFTADNNFNVNGTNDCTIGSDIMLTIEGAVVVNAALDTGGFHSYRDLCANDVNYPTVMIKERPDFILHAPDVIKQQNYLFREIAP